MEVKPNGAGPGAAGVKITGLVLNSSENRGLHTSINCRSSLYCFGDYAFYQEVTRTHKCQTALPMATCCVNSICFTAAARV